MEQHRDHDERVYGVRPAMILDATRESADWIRDPRYRDPAAQDGTPPEEPRR